MAILGSFDCMFLDKSHPPVFEFLPFVENNGDERAHVLNRKGRGRDAALAFMHLALCCKHTTPNKPFDYPPGYVGFLVYVRVLQDVSYCDRVQWEKSGFPLEEEEYVTCQDVRTGISTHRMKPS